MPVLSVLFILHIYMYINDHGVLLDKKGKRGNKKSQSSIIKGRKADKIIAKRNKHEKIYKNSIYQVFCYTSVISGLFIAKSSMWG